jgi:hypothetical protein
MDQVYSSHKDITISLATHAFRYPARGSVDILRDLTHKNANAEQFKAILAAEIIKTLDREA